VPAAVGPEVASVDPVFEARPSKESGAGPVKGELDDKARSLREQGEVRLQDGDIAGARMFFKKAADAGDAQAAMAMGATFDPRLFATLNVKGMSPDIAAARLWYQRAIDLGSKDAYERIRDLNP
jgi:TPR repeat protein